MSAEELRGECYPTIRGAKTVVMQGKVVKRSGENAARAKRWTKENHARKLAYQAQYDAARRPEANARVASYAERNPERRKKQLRAAARRYWRRRRSAVLFLLLCLINAPTAKCC